MVHKKAKSKRGTAREKYKIIKNVAETHRKRRKEAKKNPKRTAKKKDPGIPNNYPFKEELLHTAKIMKEQKIQEKLEAMEKKKNQKATLLNSDIDLETFMENLEKEKSSNLIQSAYQSARPKKHQPALMVMEQAQVLLHVLDARDPIFYRAQSLEKLMTRKQKIVFVLNKIDLITRDVAEKWIAYLVSQKLTVVPLNSMNPSKESLDYLESHLPKSPETKIGVIGFPLCGKTSLIQAIEASGRENLIDRLLPVPGIVFSQTSNPDNSARILLRNYKNAAHVPTPSITVEAIISRFSKDQLSKSFNVPFYIDSADLLVQFAKKNNYLRRGGVADTESAARGIIQDFYSDKLSYYTIPPYVFKNSISKNLAKVLDSITMLSEKGFKTLAWDECMEILDLEELPKGYEFAGQVEEEEDEDEEDEEEDEFEDEEEDEFEE